MKAQAAPAVPAIPDAGLVLVTPAARAKAQAALKRFEEAIQSLLDTRLDAERVTEWTTLRALCS